MLRSWAPFWAHWAPPVRHEWHGFYPLLGKENSPQMGCHQSSPALVTVTLGCWTPSWIYPKRHRSGTSGTYFSPQMGKEADPRLGCHPSRQHWSRRRLGPPRRRRLGANGRELNPHFQGWRFGKHTVFDAEGSRRGLQMSCPQIWTATRSGSPSKHQL